MTAGASAEHILWRRLLEVVDALAEPGATLDDVKAQLLALEEGFSHVFDPADQYAEYVAVLLCQALRRKLDAGVRAGVQQDEG